ncbi:MAG: hypothetical protein RLN70_03440, partial [Rhodospirillaceae bacterium]
VIHNTGTSETAVDLGIYDAVSGARLGTYTTGNIPPNAQAVVSMAEIEADTVPSPIVPASGRFHYVVRADTAFTGYMRHLVENTASAVTTDMTAACELAPQ